MRRKIQFLLWALILPASLSQAQVMIKAGAGSVVHIDEIQTIFLEKNGVIVAEAILPVDKRPEAYRDLQINKNDTLLMVNGKRVETAAELESLYKACRTGEPFKLGLRGKEGLKIVAFNKMEPETGMKKKIMKVEVKDEDGKMVKQVIDENGKVLTGEEAEKFIKKMEKELGDKEKGALKVEVEEPQP